MHNNFKKTGENLLQVNIKNAILQNSTDQMISKLENGQFMFLGPYA